jgi:hypothetical protein
VQRLQEKIIFSLLGWLLITMMILAIMACDPAQLERSGGDLVGLLASGYFTHKRRSASASQAGRAPKGRRNDDQLDDPVVSVDDRASHGAAALGARPPDGRLGSWLLLGALGGVGWAGAPLRDVDLAGVEID